MIPDNCTANIENSGLSTHFKNSENKSISKSNLNKQKY